MQRLSKLLDGVAKYLVAAVVVAVPLYPKFPFIEVPGTYVSIRLEDFLLAGVAVVTMIKILPRAGAVVRDDVVRAIILFLAVGLVSLLSGVFLTETAPASIGFLHLLRRVEYFVPLLLILAFYSDSRKLPMQFFSKVLMLTIFLIFIYGVGQRYLGFPVIATQNLETSKGIALRWTPGTHLNSTFAGHYDLASFLILTLPAVVVNLFLSKGLKTKVVLFSVWICGLWLLAGAVSRISIVSYLGATILALVVAKKYRAVPIAILVSLLFFGMSTDLLSRYTRIFEVTKIKIRQIISVQPGTLYAAEEPFLERRRATPTPAPVNVFEDRSTSIRFKVEWPRAIRAFSKNPLLGTGFSSITLATDNDYLRLLGEVGVLGFAAFVLVLARLAKRLLITTRNLEQLGLAERGFVAGFIGALPGVLLNAAFIDVFEASKFAIIFWLLAGFVVVIATKHETS